MSDCGVFCTIGNWLWGDLSDYGEVSVRIPTPTATACVSAGEDQCQALRNKPEVVSGLAVTSPNLTAAGTLPYGSPVNFEIETNACNGQAGNLKVTLVIGSSGGIQEFPMTDSDGNGIFSAQLTAFYWNAPITVVIKDLDRGTEVRQQAYQVPTVIPGDTEPADQCAWSPAPTVIGIPQMTGDPSNVFAGDTLSFFFPAGEEDEYGGLTGSGIIQCDGVTSADADNNIEVSFIVEETEYPASLIDGYYKSPAVTMTTVGNQKIYMKVTDILHGATCQWPYPSIEFYVKPVDAACGDAPEPLAFVVSAPNPGSDYDVDSGTPVTWQIWTQNCDGTTDGLFANCNFGPLGIASGAGDADGVITIAMPLTAKLTGSFPCDITGSNAAVLANGATLYPPYYLSESEATTLCEETFDRPVVGALSVNPTSLNVLGQIIYGSPVTFDLGDTTDCTGDTANLVVTLHAGTSTATMINTGGIYSATLNAGYWGTPISAVVEDVVRGTTTTSYLYSLPPIVPADVASCEADPAPHTYTIVGPTPLTDYDISSGTPVVWQIWAQNCDGTTNGLSAECDFGPLGTAAGTGDASGVITVALPLSAQLTGSFPCNITGSNLEVLENGATLYPPYYLSPVVAPTACEESADRPQIGALSINPASLNALGQIVTGTPVVFDLPNTSDCDGAPADLTVTLYAGTSPTTMVPSGSLYTASVTGAYWGTPITAVAHDNVRDTSSTSFLWSLPPIVTPAVSACVSDPAPSAFIVVGPTPPNNYNIASGIPVVWQIYTENCDGTTSGLSATCNFGPLGPATGTSNPSGVITISKILTSKLGGNFPCDITGSNLSVLDNGAILYPPYYTP